MQLVKQQALGEIVRRLSPAAAGYLEDREFQETLCKTCPWREWIPATATSPGEWDCPVRDEDPFDPHCPRQAQVLDVAKALEGVDEIWKP